MRFIFNIVSTAALLLSAITVVAQNHNSTPKQAMFKTKAEAEAAAESFGCTGAHQMGEMWMVCSKHGDVDHMQHQ